MGIPTPTLSPNTALYLSTIHSSTTMAINDKISNNLNTAKVAVKSLKNRLLSKLKFKMGKPQPQQMQDTASVSSYESLPSHREEADDNALNEALEARLMELIASAPAQETPVTFKLSAASVPSTPSSPISIDGYGWPVFNFASFPQYQSRCQDAQAQS